MRAILVLLSGSLLFAQLDSNSVTVTASRSIAIQPDQVIFAVSVSAPMAASLDDVVAALQGSGITATQLSSVNTSELLAITGNLTIGPNLVWAFSVPEPLAKLKDTLTAIQKSLAQLQKGFSLSFGVEGTQASQQLTASQQCSKADLIADAAAQANKMTNAAGFVLGPILALSSINTTGVIGAAIPITVRQGDFSGLLPGNGQFSVSTILPTTTSFLIGGVFSPLLPPPQPVTCSLTVKFGLIRN